MRSNSTELAKQMRDVLDEIIPAIPVDHGMSAMIARIDKCILKAAAEAQANYQTLLAAASAEIEMISQEQAWFVPHSELCSRMSPAAPGRY